MHMHYGIHVCCGAGLTAMPILRPRKERLSMRRTCHTQCCGSEIKRLLFQCTLKLENTPIDIQGGISSESVFRQFHA